MLVITYNNEKVWTTHCPVDFSKIPNIKEIKEVYVDGDELASFFGLPSSHGARGITLSGKGLETLMGYHLSKSLNKLFEEDEKKFKIVVLDPSDDDPTWDQANGVEIWEVETPFAAVNTVHDFIVHSKVPLK